VSSSPHSSSVRRARRAVKSSGMSDTLAASTSSTTLAMSAHD
jgi:hypothetical protein